MDEVLWALKDDLGILGSYAAAQIDLFINKKGENLEALDHLGHMLKSNLHISQNHSKQNSDSKFLSVDQETAIVMSWVINDNQDDEKTVEEIITETGDFAEQLKLIYKNPDSYLAPERIKELEFVRDKCLQISRKASAYEESLNLSYQTIKPSS